AGAEMTAIDSNAAVIEKAEAEAAAYGTPITFVHERVEDHVQSGEKYDVLLCLDVLEDVADPTKFLWSLRQLLKPQGVLILSAINRTPKAWFVHIFLSEYLLRRTPRGHRKYHRFYTPAQLRKVLATHNMALKTVQGMMFDPTLNIWRLTPAPDTRYLATVTSL
ncbi:MAG: bifunctional 2-polyprenyl-6-hydroxyphenol methylase/3-demethylubiquinol 3-O-methyltransferase UbiG, partial [Alphaproteobacteria bacterium]